MSNVDHRSGEATEINDEKHLSEITYRSTHESEGEPISVPSAAYRMICIVLLLLSYFLSQYDK